MPRRRNTGSGSVWKRGRYYWIAWTQDGKRIKESSGCTLKSEAQTVLDRKLAARAAGIRAAKGVPLTIRELVDLVIADYEANKRRSTDRAQRSADHLVRVLGDLLGGGKTSQAASVDEATVTAYIVHRQREGAAVATVNRELACLRRALRLAVRAHRLDRRPDFQTLAESNTRKGFVEREQLEAILAHLDEDLRPVVQVAYLTGWRVRSEVLTRERRHVDLAAGWLRIEPGEDKSGEGRMYPLFPELLAVLKAQEARTVAMERKQGRKIPWLFHRDGEQIKGFRMGWAAACKAAGLPGKYLHDFRRSNVRNLERSGVPRSAAMAMVGHKTEAIYRRYAIVDEAMLREAGAKLAMLSPAAPGAARKKKGGRRRS